MPFGAGWDAKASNLRPPKFALGIAQLALGFLALWWVQRTTMISAWSLWAGCCCPTCCKPRANSAFPGGPFHGDPSRASPHRVDRDGCLVPGHRSEPDLAGLIAKLTAIEPTDGEAGVPVPLETVDIYAGVFGQIGVAALVVM